MPADTFPPARRARVSAFIADALGLHFPPERWPDLKRGLQAASAEFGLAGVDECADWLLSSPPTRAQVQVLAAHLTVGETYFFREPAVFDVLRTQILPALVESRRSEGRRRLRLWSAGCCTGEEPYSLAILLHELLPDLADWHITILATDINPGFLRKAVAGAYGKWSFRGTPPEFRERWFRRDGAGRHVLVPEIRRMATFAHLNLADDHYPSLATDTNAMDLIFCRNVLMYFPPARTGRVIDNLHRALADDGWLAVSPSEAAPDLFTSFAIRHYSGAILYQKSDEARPEGPTTGMETAGWFIPEAPVPGWAVPPADDDGPAAELEELPPPPSAGERAAAAYARGQYADVTDILLAPDAGSVRDPRSFSLLARACANQGKLGDALAWCDRWLAADKTDATGHYLRAMILLEQGDEARARTALQRALYLAPAFVPAHFVLGNLARAAGRGAEATRHFGNALELLGRLEPADILPESDGLTAGRLVETISALMPAEATP